MLISFGAVIGKASLIQLVVMAIFEVVVQGINEHIGLHYLHVCGYLFIIRYLILVGLMFIVITKKRLTMLEKACMFMFLELFLV